MRRPTRTPRRGGSRWPLWGASCTTWPSTLAGTAGSRGSAEPIIPGMAGDDEQAEPRSANGDERRAFVRFSALVAAAAGTLVLGAVLQGPPAPPPPPAPRTVSGEP